MRKFAVLIYPDFSLHRDNLSYISISSMVRRENRFYRNRR